MRKVLCLAALLALAACGGVDEIDITRSGTATVPGSAGGAPLPSGAIATFDLGLGRAALEQEGIDPNDVDSARLVGLRLEAVTGPGLEAWLESVSFHVEAPGLPRVLLAQRSGIRALAAGTRAVDLETPGADLKPYLLAPTATVTAEGAGTAPAQETQLRATATIRVDVSVSGLLD
jgi:hypothetical protein